ncbi:hypothetical protein [Streptomyces sp. WAC00469]|uniref:hypothetical protein n=1 Tax=Streptomyces sp. WAC00469 TaxID=2487415 RepID=UPI000F739DF5|nr:hypothetical protein [Streptomyces sp. WAC00469]RSS07270.1 hypothetical protein EF917_05300 [Streptomyces sp. WAC00469]
MLARLPLPWLLLMAAFATSLIAWETHAVYGIRKLTAAIIAISVLACLGMIAEGRAQDPPHNARQMLVIYSFTWAGAAIGLFWTRRFWFEWRDDRRKGVRRDYVLPRRYKVAMNSTFVVMLILGVLLAG